MRVQTVTYRREMPGVKHVGLFGLLRGRRQGQLSGYDDALFVDSASFVYEGATWNVGFFDGHRVVWPDAEVLPGVTMRLLKQVHYQTVTMPVRLRDLSSMEAAFAANAGVGARAISAIDTVQMACDHPILDTLRREYEEIPAETI
jgi:branched-subunit amino acid aminotransferase/4-amino-4-deoxychorismate lyase